MAEIDNSQITNDTYLESEKTAREWIKTQKIDRKEHSPEKKESKENVVVIFFL